MANIFDLYGIKEVADVTFYDIETNTPVLYLDTLKVSTIETTGEESDATGGKGNATQIIWDYGREITLNIEDALYSPASMALMFGQSLAGMTSTTRTITRNIRYTATATGALPTKVYKSNGVPNGAGDTAVSWFKGGSPTPVSTATAIGDMFIGQYSFDAMASQILINANRFPGTYRIVGDTFARRRDTGKDDFFQFIVPMAKMSSETTIALEAEGDPSTFSMNMRVLRPADGNMLELLQYTVA